MQYVKSTQNRVFLHRFNLTFTVPVPRSHQPTVGATETDFTFQTFLLAVWFSDVLLLFLD
jgi:hypothetical protein